MAKNKQATRAQDRFAQFYKGFRFFVLAILTLSVASMLTWGWYKLHCSDLFPVREVSILGQYSHVDSGSLKASIIPFTQRSFFFLDLEGLKEKLLEQPWIAEAEITRQWPNHLVIHLVEQKAVAIWNGSNLLSSSGTVFSPPLSTFPQHLPFFSAPAGQQQRVMNMFQHISEKISILNLSVLELDLTPRLAWYMRLNNGLQIVLGRDNIDTRLQRFTEAYTQLFANRISNVDYVDLRYSNGFAVKWKEQNKQAT
jgi:cell division protein FtsQ